MRRSVLLALLFAALLASAAVVRAEEEAPAADGEVEDEEDYAEAERAHLIVRKHVAGLGVQGRNVTVNIELYNAGTASASDVQLKDATIPEGLSLLEGSMEASLGKIEPSTSVSHSYSLLADKGSFVAEFAPAVVTYKAEYDSADVQTARSTLTAIMIMTPREQIMRWALQGGSYMTLGMATTAAHWRNLAAVVLLAGVAWGVSSGHKSYQSSSAQSRRAKALAELEKEQ